MQRLTSEWWNKCREQYNLLTSELVLLEASGGDTEASRERLSLLHGLEILQTNESAQSLARILVETAALPQSASRDALHVAIAAVNGADFLLTWNFKHLANAQLRPKIVGNCQRSGFNCPTICTPEELQGRP